MNGTTLLPPWGKEAFINPSSHRGGTGSEEPRVRRQGTFRTSQTSGEVVLLAENNSLKKGATVNL